MGLLLSQKTERSIKILKLMRVWDIKLETEREIIRSSPKCDEFSIKLKCLVKRPF